MLSLSQPFFCALDELLTHALNYHVARFRHQTKNKKTSAVIQHETRNFENSLTVTQFFESVKLLSIENPINFECSDKKHIVNDLITFVNHHKITNNDIFAGGKRPRHNFTINVANLTIAQTKSGLITLQRRGFRTKSYQSSGGQKSTLKEDRSILGYFGLSSRIKSAWQKHVKDENLKSLLDSTEMKGQEKVKMAFAEGYLAADQKKRKMPFLQTIFYLLLIATIGYTIYQNFGQFRFAAGISQVTPEDVTVSFEDVKGIEEAKDQVMQIVDYLKDPVKYTRLGARLPKGVLLVGLPGSGKTLLARAIAGEAQVPFFRTSGSEFEEMLVGLGAKRIRDLFSAARSRSPCVIFIDEIDSIGSKRSYSAFHPYANQTINQLLTEMDGFLSASGVIVLAATNRPQDLDPALLRPGRFDVQIVVPWPDLKGRIEIFKYYLAKVKVDEDVNVEKLALSTIGFSGADIENMVNQAALKAATDNKNSVNMHYLEMAHDLVKLGPAKKTLPSDFEVNQTTAYHEAGHTLVAFFTKDADPLHRVTIVPRGLSLGMTSLRPDKELYQQTKAQLLAQMDVCMGGRAAEELVFGPDKITTGASDDFSNATRIAELMVKEFGMSEKVGYRKIGKQNDTAFVSVNDYSPATIEGVDSEIKRFIQESYDRAKLILKQHSAAHKRIAEALLKYETLDAEDVKTLIEGKPLNKTLIPA